jgi:DNA-binding Lrp family transcriptional regulator
MVAALVLVNCHFPFDTRILEEISNVPMITDVYRTEGRYDLIIKVTAETEEKLKEVITKNIEEISGVDATIPLTIADQATKSRR